MVLYGAIKYTLGEKREDELIVMTRMNTGFVCHP